jgi:hypothetical protein
MKISRLHLTDSLDSVQYRTSILLLPPPPPQRILSDASSESLRDRRQEPHTEAEKSC